MRHSLLRTIVQLEKHWVCNMKAGKLVQCARRHDDLAAVIDVLSLGPRKHGNWITTVVFIEATSGATRGNHAAAEYALHGVVEVTGSELNW